MKKTIAIIIVILICCAAVLSFFLIKNQKDKEKIEAVEIIGRHTTMEVTVKKSVDDINAIKSQIENLECVKSVEIDSTESRTQRMKEMISTEIEGLSEILSAIPDSLLLEFELNSIDDLEKIENTKKAIQKIDGVDELKSSGFDTIVEVYNKLGIKALREYDKVLTISTEQGPRAAVNYLDEHNEVRKLLKGYIHF
jgi:cell division protein FtsX